MAIEVRTTDCTALGDSDFAAMAELAEPSTGWEVGTISKEAQEWVLATRAEDGGQLQGFMFCTLERIGGTPAMVVGMASIGRTRQRSSILKALMTEGFHKSLMAFPDEDVLVATRLTAPGGLEALTDLNDVRPWPETRANGEERAWGRRLSKRFGAVGFDDRSMVARGDGESAVFDHESLRKLDGTSVLEGCDVDGGEFVISWGWAMAEFLEQFR